VNASELLEYADAGVLVRPWLHVIDELLKLSPTISDPQEIAAGNSESAERRGLASARAALQAPQSRDPPAADPGPVNPEDNRRLSVYPQVEVEPTADVCPSCPARDAVDQGRDGRIIWAGSRSKPARQGREEAEASIPVMAMARQHTRRRVRRMNPSSSTRVDRATHVPAGDRANVG
jgi:hypothetical protein